MGVRPLVQRACVLSALLTGCDHTVALGTECPPIGETCIDARNRTPPVRKPEEPDAGTDASLGPEEDASVDGGDAAAPLDDGGAPDAGMVPVIKTPPPALVNGSFELTAGKPAGGSLGTFSSAKIEPWYTCSGSVGARPEDDLRNTPIGMASPTDLIRPSDQDTLVSMSFGAGPATLVQELAMPLMKGERYAFVIDIVRSGGSDVRLQAWGANGSCIPAERLAESPSIPEKAGWKSICLAFTPQANYRELVLMTSPIAGARLFLDNIRSDPSCE